MWLWWVFWWPLPQVTIIWVVSLTRGAVLVALLDVGRPTLKVHSTFWLQPWNIGMAEGRQVLYCLLCFSLVTWFTLWLLLQMPSVTPEPMCAKLPLWVKDQKLSRKFSTPDRDFWTAPPALILSNYYLVVDLSSIRQPLWGYSHRWGTQPSGEGTTRFSNIRQVFCYFIVRWVKKSINPCWVAFPGEPWLMQ